MLYPLLKEGDIPENVNITIYKTVLRPILIYGCAAWVLIKKRKCKMQVAKMSVVRLNTQR